MDISLKETRIRKYTFGDHFRVLCASVVLLILISPTVATQGIYIAYLQKNNFLPDMLLWMPTLFLASFYIFRPWCREFTENWIENGSRHLKLNMFCAFLVPFCICVSGYLNTLGQILTFGIINGLSTSLLISRIEAFLSDKYQYHQISIHILIQFSIAIGHLILPKVIDILIYKYTKYNQNDVLLLYGAIILNIIPATMLLKNSYLYGPPVVTSRYSNYQRPDKLLKGESTKSINTLETPNASNNDLSSNNLVITNSFRNWKNPSDSTKDFDSNYETSEEKSDSSSNSSSGSVEYENVTKESIIKNTNFFGVEILPEIPEETESISSYSITDDSEDNINESYRINLHRLSMISNQLEQMINHDQINNYINNSIVNEKQPETSNITEHAIQINENSDIYAKININKSQLQHSVTEWDSTDHNISLKQQKSNNRCHLCCAPYKIFSLQIYCARQIDNIKYILGLPFMRSISIIEFYPTLLLKICTVLNLFTFTTLMPIYIKTLKHHDMKQNSSSFYTSIASLSWISVLILTPVIVNIPKSLFKYISVIGLLFLTYVFYKIINTPEEDFQVTSLSVNSIVFGFSFGAVSFVEITVIRNELGIQNFSKVQGTIETITGFFIIIYFFTINVIFYKYQIKVFFNAICGLNIINSFIWLIVILVQYFKKRTLSNISIELSHSFSPN